MSNCWSTLPSSRYGNYELQDPKHITSKMEREKKNKLWKTFRFSSRCQFHQHFTCPLSYESASGSFYLLRVWLLNKLLYEKFASKMLMKLTAGCNKMLRPSSFGLRVGVVVVVGKEDFILVDWLKLTRLFGFPWQLTVNWHCLEKRTNYTEGSVSGLVRLPRPFVIHVTYKFYPYNTDTESPSCTVTETASV